MVTEIDSFKSQLAWLREAYKSETDPERRKRLKADTEQLKENYGCYECRENGRDEVLEWFCSLKCKDMYGDKHYGKQKDGSRILTIKQMQERLQEMAQEKRINVSPGRRDV